MDIRSAKNKLADMGEVEKNKALLTIGDVIDYGECFTVEVSYGGINLHQAHTWLQLACKMISHNTTQQYFADVEVIESMVDRTP